MEEIYDRTTLESDRKCKKIALNRLTLHFSDQNQIAQSKICCKITDVHEREKANIKH